MANTKKDKETKEKSPPDYAPTLRIVPMPADTNAYGDIFGGWLLSQMDIAGASAATKLVKQRVVTVGIERMSFHNPVIVGDEVSFFTDIQSIGRTSVTIHIEAWARAREDEEFQSRMVTEGVFSFVAIDKARRPLAINNNLK